MQTCEMQHFPVAYTSKHHRGMVPKLMGLISLVYGRMAAQLTLRNFRLGGFAAVPNNTLQLTRSSMRVDVHLLE